MAGVAVQATLHGLATFAAKVGIAVCPRAGGQGVRGGVQGVLRRQYDSVTTLN